ncbi:MAG: TonB-dependent receptor plug domain-containing protein [Myxococcales bacterium]|nr:TonB-dependent receptor plug domain-containing protein [Myxococcales bacterium]
MIFVSRLLLALSSVVYIGFAGVLLVTRPVLAEPVEAGRDALDDEFIISEVELEERDSVFVATKTRKTLQEAPAIVTVLTGADMDRAGFRTLNEALHTVPGFEHSNTGRWDFLFTRGNAFTVSVLVNGIPIVNPGDNLVFLDQAYPINIIDRVEVISGPGGILWGANAFLGVINIVTKKGADIDGMFFEWGSGSFNTDRGAVGFGKVFGDLDVMFLANYQTTHEGSVDVRRRTIGLAPDFAFPPDDADPDNPTVYNPDGPPIFQNPGRTDPRNDKFLDFIGQIRWHGLSLFANLAWEEDYYQLSSSTGAILGNSQSLDKDPNQMVGLGYTQRFFEERLGVHSKAYLWSQNFQVDSIIFPSLPNTIPNDFVIQLKIDRQIRYGGGLEIDARLPFGMTLLAGVEAFREEIAGARVRFQGPNTGNLLDGGELVPDSESNVVSAYANQEINLLERIAIAGGVRFNYSDTYASAFLFSGNVVGHLLDGESLQAYAKFSYTQGFRPPSFEQRFGTNPFFLGDSSIGPERSEAIQAELNAKLLMDTGLFKRIGVRIDYAHTELNDLIATQSSADGSSAQFDNLDTRSIDSVEVSGEMLFLQGHRLWLGYSFNELDATNAVTGESTSVRSHAPHVFNVGGNLRFNQNTSLNARYSWVASKRIDTYFDPETQATGSLRISSYSLLAAGLILNDDRDRYRLLIHGYNLLGQHYETLDGDTVAAPYPYPQPERPAVLVRVQLNL